MLVASLVSPDESALWSDLRKLVISSPTLDVLLLELLLSEEEPGALDNISDTRFEASDVSPDFRSLATVLSASDSGF
jgi:hypothetical protein